MTPDLKAKWIAALRSGDYEQGQGALRKNSSFCCLGVLCDIQGKGWQYCDDTGSYELAGFGDTGEALPMDLQEEFGLPDKVETELIHQNDGRDGTPPHSFLEIADWIEKNL